MNAVLHWTRACLLVLAFVGEAGAEAPQPIEAQQLPMRFGGESPPLWRLARDPVMRVPDYGQWQGEWELDAEPESRSGSVSADAIASPPVQTSAPQPSTLVPGTTFEGPGTGIAGFVITGAPSDATLAVGPTRIVAWVNTQFMIFDRAGTVLLPATNGNTLWAGVGGVCQANNRGDPLVQYDRRADRWIFSQWAFAFVNGNPAAPVAQCFAVSTSGDPAGTYYRYVLDVSGISATTFADYAKLGVWHDAYYTAYDLFSIPSFSFSGAGLCASDRDKMLSGDPTATTLCAPFTFDVLGLGYLPADLDGTTLPGDTNQGGVFVRYSSLSGQSLRIVKLKPDFVAGTVTVAMDSVALRRASSACRCPRRHSRARSPSPAPPRGWRASAAA